MLSQIYFRCAGCEKNIPLGDEEEWDKIPRVGINNEPVCRECFTLIQSRIKTRQDWPAIQEEIPRVINLSY